MKSGRLQNVLTFSVAVFCSCVQHPSQPGDPSEVDIRFSNEVNNRPELSRFVRRVGLTDPSTASLLTGQLSAQAAINIIDEAQIAVLDFTRWDSDNQALAALDVEPDSLYDATRFDIRRDIWDNLVFAFKAYRGSVYKFSGQYPLSIRDGVAHGVISAPPGFNLFFASLRSKGKTIHLYSALVYVASGRRQPVVLFETTAEGAHLNNVAMWTGSGWVAVSGGFDGPVFAMASDGAYLYAGGKFSSAGTATAPNIARFDGTAWRPLGAGINDTVFALAASGSVVYAGGAFSRAGVVNATGVASWNGASWQTLGTGVSGTVRAVAVDTSSLVVGGDITSAGGAAASGVARWNGSTWSSLTTGVNGTVYAVAVAPPNGVVVAAGDFSRAGGLSTNGIAAFNGTSWVGLGSGFGGILSSVRALSVFGADLFAGGRFTVAGGSAAENVARWNTNAWTQAGNGLSGTTVRALANNGTTLVAAGSFIRSGTIALSNIAVWNGTGWAPLKSGLDGPVHTVAFHQGKLFAGGEFMYSR